MSTNSKRNDRPRTAGDLMASPAITLGADSTVADVAKEMVERNIGSIIIVDDEGRYRGIMTETEFQPTQTVYPFLRGRVSELMGRVIGTEDRLDYEKAIAMLRTTVASEVMDTTVPTAEASTGLDEIVELMAMSKGNHVPVLKNGKPIGMIARHDFLHLFLG